MLGVAVPTSKVPALVSPTTRTNKPSDALQRPFGA